MPVEFLSDVEAAAYGRFVGAPSQAELAKVFFLDDDDLELIERRRGTHMKLGFAQDRIVISATNTAAGAPSPARVFCSYLAVGEAPQPSPGLLTASSPA